MHDHAECERHDHSLDQLDEAVAQRLKCYRNARILPPNRDGDARHNNVRTKPRIAYLHLPI
jgi:hypothetical protein